MLPSVKKNSSITTRMADQVLSCNLFSNDDDNNKNDDEIEREKKKDPLSSQVWRMYTKAKDNLPNGSRLENLTWRMMAMTLNKTKNQQEQNDVASEPMDSEPEFTLNNSKSPPIVSLLKG